MRGLLTIGVGLVVLALGQAQGQEKELLGKRHGVVADLTKYPQDTPEKALASVVKAVENKDIDYLLAQLVEPKFVDDRVAELTKNGGAKPFQQFVQETQEHFQNDPTRIKELARFAKDGQFTTNDKASVVTLKAVPVRRILLRKTEGRWFMDNRET